MNPNSLTNEEIDARVRAAIGKGYGRASEIESLVLPTGRGGDTMRAIDRSLQRLRKRGEIELHGAPRRWRVKP